MIRNSAKIQTILSRIIRHITIIKDDFHFNKKTSREFMLEKLNRAKDDIEALINFVEIEKEKKCK